MRFDRIALHGAAVAIAMMSAAAARADNSATGLWIDHTGRGAVEITECNGKLCGHVAWVQDAKNSDQCGKQIIGNVKPVGKNKWDNGWIYDPDSGSKYDVELTPVGTEKLKVVGYAGTKWLSETYTWKRAPADLQKCNTAGDSAKATTPAPATADKPAETAKKDEAKPDTATKPNRSEPTRSSSTRRSRKPARTLRSPTRRSPRRRIARSRRRPKQRRPTPPTMQATSPRAASATARSSPASWKSWRAATAP